MGNHKNRRHGNNTRIHLPKFMTKYRLPCLRRYADSDSGSDLQQESLLDRVNEAPTMTEQAWAGHVDTVDVEDSEQENVPFGNPVSPPLGLNLDVHNTPFLTVNTSTSRTESSRPLTDTSNVIPHANRQLYQMPKFNSRMWQDGFGRFRRDTIPRRDNLGEASPVPSHRESINGDSNPNNAQTWYCSPMLTGLGSTANNLALLHEVSPILVDVNQARSEDEMEELWRDLEDSRNTDDCSTDSVDDVLAPEEENPIDSMENRNSTEQTRTSNWQFAAPAQSASLAAILLSLPGQNGGNTFDNNQNTSSGQSCLSDDNMQTVFNFRERPDNSNSTAGGVSVDVGNSNVANSDGDNHSAARRHRSLFEVLEQLQQNVQDNITRSCSNSSQHDNRIETSESPNSSSNPSVRSASTVSSTLSNMALFQHIVDILTSNNRTENAIQSISSTHSSVSSTSQPNWYFYDRRLVPNRDLDRATMLLPPSYEEAQEFDRNFNFLGVLPTDPPPPYPSSDISPPPPYCDCLDCGDSLSINSARTESHIIEIADQNEQTIDLQTCIARARPIALPRVNLNFNFARTSSIPEPEVYGGDPTVRGEDNRIAASRVGNLGLGGRPPPMRWNRGMGLDRWASTHNWAITTAH